MVFTCDACDFTTKQAGSLKRHVNRKNSTCLPPPAATAVKAEAAPTKAVRGRRKKVMETPSTQPAPPQEAPVAPTPQQEPPSSNNNIQVFVNGMDISNLPSSYWDYTSGKFITKDVIDDYDNLIATLCDGIHDEENLKGLAELRDFFDKWRKDKDTHNKKVVLECLHDFRSLMLLMEAEVNKQKKNDALNTSA